MKILFTGASSFTGSWFCRSLAQAGHQIYGTLQGNVGSYNVAQQARFAFMAEAGVVLLESHVFGLEAFLETLTQGFDIVCLHGAYVHDYKSPDFDTISAVTANTLNLAQVLRTAKAAGTARIIATGSVFEEGEGVGDAPLSAVSPYGLSKSMTWSMMRSYCEWVSLPVTKFVIPNPFGPFEEPRFCAYLMKSWAEGKTATVSTPGYIRDNIAIDLLATVYEQTVDRARSDPGESYVRPSGYVESQGAFTLRFAKEIGSRLGINTPLEFANQTEFSEPRMRVNANRVTAGWDESAFWDRLAAFYKEIYF